MQSKLNHLTTHKIHHNADWSMSNFICNYLKADYSELKDTILPFTVISLPLPYSQTGENFSFPQRPWENKLTHINLCFSCFDLLSKFQEEFRVLLATKWMTSLKFSITKYEVNVWMLITLHIGEVWILPTCQRAAFPLQGQPTGD